MAEDIAYLRIKQFQQGTHDELLDVLGSLRRGGKLRAMILDMRGNPGGLVNEAVAVADEFLSLGGIYSTRHRGKIDEEVRAHRGGAVSSLPLVTLVNEYSASAAELVAGALQDNGRSPIVGAKTFGKGSVQTIFSLAGHAGLRLTTMRYYTPKGHAIQARGIFPDIAIQYTSDSAPAALSETTLDGHLPAEHKQQGPEPKRRVAGGQRPKYTPLTKVLFDPRKGSDIALREAFEEARRRVVD
jgi:carboxyl-terminal processing protease